MKRVAADFRRPPQPGKALRLLVLVAGVALCAAIIDALLARQAVSAALAELRAAAAANQSDQSLAAPALPLSRHLGVDELLRDRGLLWPEALRSLEEVETPGVRATSFEAFAETGLIRVEFEAPDHEHLIAHVGRLKAFSDKEALSLSWRLVRMRHDATAGATQATLEAQATGAVLPASVLAR